ncbi:DMSO/TMAO reductase YedYZ molybdopterin-dependent catalytic subunit [Catenulispora sp. EB89]|uniref:sulfite oxidase-like oxidoreductase n=1 Tax=Catenulispora sp. EB89 TaxID=3156257 RepID=UPI0035141770
MGQPGSGVDTEGETVQSDDRLPPGQRMQRGEWPVLHYGPVPRFKPATWDFRVTGATADGAQAIWFHEEFGALPSVEVTADFHCVTKFTMLDAPWRGVSGRTVLELAPPAPDATHVTVWAEYGYSSNLRIEDLLRENVLFATHYAGVPLTPEHGFPLRLIVPHLYAWKGPKWVRGIEYLTTDRRGFWEERGYHNIGDPWKEQRYSYQEDPGDGPPL